MSAEYEIKTVADFLTVPADRIGACLEDFTSWLKAARSLSSLEGVKFDLKAFKWVDDDLQGVGIVTVTVVSPEEFKDLA